jgi:hypothetical protein
VYGKKDIVGFCGTELGTHVMSKFVLVKPAPESFEFLVLGPIKVKCCEMLRIIF